MAKRRMTSSIAAHFLAQSAPRVQAVVFLLAAVTRAITLARGQSLTWADAAVAGGLLVAMPFVEWAVHSRVLHAKPIQWRGRALVLAATRAHAAHHADPHDGSRIVTPLPALIPLLPVVAGAALLPSWSLRATALAMLALLVLSTEWVHFLVHAQPAPKSAWLRRRSRAHRLHHYRDERYWFGLTSGFADRVLGTAPSRDATPIRNTRGLCPTDIRAKGRSALSSGALD
jgi:sterol desaturase/sphingolipid hydroxylase (fatty acid hydroxylase superfamily)